MDGEDDVGDDDGILLVVVDRGEVLELSIALLLVAVVVALVVVVLLITLIWFNSFEFTLLLLLVLVLVVVVVLMLMLCSMEPQERQYLGGLMAGAIPNPRKKREDVVIAVVELFDSAVEL
jgi:Ca2+/Na+ antiporter